MPKIDYKKFTLARLDDFISQITLLKELEFPYEDSSLALDIIYNHFIALRKGVETSILTDGNLKSRCSRATQQIFFFHRFLGYIAKSSDPINSFEIYFSFRRLAASILGNDVRLIISSEWESYSPVNYTIPKELEKYVFIGLPVSKADNALIVPLSGHELGHSIWYSSSANDSYRQQLTLLLNKKKLNLKVDDKTQIVEISLIKCEEYFCDIVGMALFGESYIYAFAYLFAPEIRDILTHSHPNAKNRADTMVKAALEFNCSVPENLTDLFKIQLDSSKLSNQKQLIISEDLALQMTDTLISDVKELFVQLNVLYNRPKSYKKIVNDMMSGAPTNAAFSLADITNAAWDIYFNDNSWKSLKLTTEQKMDFLNELTIKSFELLEIKQRLNHK